MSLITLAHTDHARNGRADLMAHVRQELALHLTRLFSRHALRHQTRVLPITLFDLLRLLAHLRDIHTDSDHAIQVLVAIQPALAFLAQEREHPRTEPALIRFDLVFDHLHLTLPTHYPSHGVTISDQLVVTALELYSIHHGAPLEQSQVVLFVHSPERDPGMVYYPFQLCSGLSCLLSGEHEIVDVGARPEPFHDLPVPISHCRSTPVFSQVFVAAFTVAVLNAKARVRIPLVAVVVMNTFRVRSPDHLRYHIRNILKLPCIFFLLPVDRGRIVRHVMEHHHATQEIPFVIREWLSARVKFHLTSILGRVHANSVALKSLFFLHQTHDRELFQWYLLAEIVAAPSSIQGVRRDVHAVHQRIFQPAHLAEHCRRSGPRTLRRWSARQETFERMAVDSELLLELKPALRLALNVVGVLETVLVVVDLATSDEEAEAGACLAAVKPGRDWTLRVSRPGEGQSLDPEDATDVDRLCRDETCSAGPPTRQRQGFHLEADPRQAAQALCRTRRLSSESSPDPSNCAAGSIPNNRPIASFASTTVFRLDSTSTGMGKYCSAAWGARIANAAVGREVVLCKPVFRLLCPASLFLYRDQIFKGNPPPAVVRHHGDWGYPPGSAPSASVHCFTAPARCAALPPRRPRTRSSRAARTTETNNDCSWLYSASDWNRNGSALEVGFLFRLVRRGMRLRRRIGGGRARGLAYAICADRTTAWSRATLVNSRPFAGDRVQLRRQKYELSFTSRLAAKGSRLRYSPTSAHHVSYVRLVSKQATACRSVRCRSQEEEAALRPPPSGCAMSRNHRTSLILN
ncbi:hypothetical protein KC349_g329 [Hortaea werneckii]|nr:hypothetical protein KC349_g329 [Hortaea werneckii]